ncbi:hypothetical protein [Actinoplanes rectilineatus]|uniref:hypothetical protein n=1 Tax=Actinoplanes rectilineatus TaxID=113571 RepID=UPI0006979536|nr:hypothetical protein [Actinoplanes rectilineatus]
MRFPDLCTDLSNGVIELDAEESTTALRAIIGAIGEVSPDELTEGARRLLPAVRQVSLGNGGQLAQVTAGLVEAGADPFVLFDALVDRVTAGLEQAARFPALAEKSGALSEPESQEEVDDLLRQVARVAVEAGLSADEAGGVVQAWFTVEDWIPALLLPLQQKRVRQAFADDPARRDRLVVAALAMSEYAESAPWLLGLLQVIDDVPVLVVHRDSGRAYRLTVSGVAENFQLNTLLAATLIGDPADGLIPGERPEQEWVDAATDGEELQPEGGIVARFDLVSADGAPTWPEGQLADIPVVDGYRVLVLDTPRFERSWNTGRVYPLMRPEVVLERILPESEAAAWMQRIKPAKRDLLGG